jgi:hypothetical protein
LNRLQQHQKKTIARFRRGTIESALNQTMDFIK